MTSPLAERGRWAESKVTGKGGGVGRELIDGAAEVSHSNWTHVYACRLPRMGKHGRTAA